MKIALLGDVHGNHLALSAVLTAARREGADRLLVTGDLVGYYFWPSEVLQLLEPWDKVVVRGNHEDLLARGRREPEFLGSLERKYGSGTRVALDTLSSSQLDWLERLPHPQEIETDGQRILLCHGAPWDVDQYVYPDANPELLARVAESNHDWVVLGHTHYPMAHRIGSTSIVNPGSVGQPRNRQQGAHWALLDTASRQLSLRSEPYDCNSIVSEAQRRHPDMPYLAKVLQGAR